MQGLFGRIGRILRPAARPVSGLSLLAAGAAGWAAALPDHCQVIVTDDHQDLRRALGEAHFSHVVLWRGTEAPSPALCRSLMAAAGKAPAWLTGPSPNAVAYVLPTDMARRLAPAAGPGADLLLWQAALRERRPAHVSLAEGWSLASRQAAQDVAPWLEVLRHLGTPDGHGVVQAALAPAIVETIATLAAAVGGDGARYAALAAQMKAMALPPHLLQAVNARLARTLVIAYCFLPHIDPSAIVMAKRIDHLALPADVISNRLGRKVPKDAGLMAALGGKVGQHVVLGTRPKLESWASVHAFIAEALPVAARLEAAKGPYAAYYSRAQWPASHFVAACCKLRHPAASWTAEFSDPLLMTSKGTLRTARLDRRWLFGSGMAAAFAARGLALPEDDRLFFWAEALPIALADRLIFTNRNQLDCMAAYQPVAALRDLLRRKAEIAPQPVPDAALYRQRQPAYAIDHRQVNIAYFGSFYKVRGLHEVVAALARLPEAQRRRIMLHVFSEQPGKVRKLPRYGEASRSIRLNGFVGYLDFLALTRRFDYLLANDAQARHPGCGNPYRPSKLSDYLGSGQPIWAVCEPGSPMAEEPLTAGSIRSRLGDGESLSAALSQMLAGHAARGGPGD